VAEHAPLLRLDGISKSFAGNRVLDGVDLECRPGEVQALLGANGAGKSTLIQIITGVYKPDAGEVWLDGEPVRFSRPDEAKRAGIASVYQELSLIDELDVAHNIYLATEPRSGWLIDRPRLYRQCEQLLGELGIALDPRAEVGSLSVARQQLVELAKALALDARIVIMDEPTAALTKAEQETLFGILADLRRRGLAVIYVSHRLEEIFRVADRVTVLRDGRLVSSAPLAETSRRQMVHDMVGDVLTTRAARAEAPVSREGTPALAVSSLSTATCRDIDFRVWPGEILGIAGLIGSGRSSLLGALFGVTPVESGTIVVDGDPVSITSIRDAVRRGIGLVTDDRKRTGLALGLPIADNLTAVRFPSKLGIVRTRVARRLSRQAADKVTLDRDLAVETGFLSGGNQQKAAVGKWIAAAPRILLCDEPTRGIDVSARAELYAVLRSLAAEGVAVIVASSDFDEILTITDRVLVLYRGEIVDEVPTANATEESLMHAAIGAGRDEPAPTFSGNG
jgi:ribose transport system ATP-binding protein